MDNLVQFPKAKRVLPTNAIPDVRHRYVIPVEKRVPIFLVNIVLNLLIFLLGGLRTLVLTVLLGLRPLLFSICRPVSGLTLLAFIVCLFAQPHDHRLYYLFGFASLGAFFIMQLYDGLLSLLSRGHLITIFH